LNRPSLMTQQTEKEQQGHSAARTLSKNTWPAAYLQVGRIQR
jgi:hypothetical protein